MSKSKQTIPENCPLCDNISIYSCGCSYVEKHCIKHHSWYVKDNKVKMGTPHRLYRGQSVITDGCSKPINIPKSLEDKKRVVGLYKEDDESPIESVNLYD